MAEGTAKVFRLEGNIFLSGCKTVSRPGPVLSKRIHLDYLKYFPVVFLLSLLIVCCCVSILGEAPFV